MKNTRQLYHILRYFIEVNGELLWSPELYRKLTPYNTLRYVLYNWLFFLSHCILCGTLTLLLYYQFTYSSILKIFQETHTHTHKSIEQSAPTRHFNSGSDCGDVFTVEMCSQYRGCALHLHIKIHTRCLCSVVCASWEM